MPFSPLCCYLRNNPQKRLKQLFEGKGIYLKYSPFSCSARVTVRVKIRVGNLPVSVRLVSEGSRC